MSGPFEPINPWMTVKELQIMSTNMSTQQLVILVCFRPNKLGTRLWKHSGDLTDSVPTFTNNTPEGSDDAKAMNQNNLISLVATNVRIGGTQRAVVYPEETKREAYR